MIVIDDFIKDHNLVDQIKSDNNFFPQDMGEVTNIADSNNYFHDGASDCYAPYMFWDGWWNSPADTLRKRVIEQIWRYGPISELNPIDMRDVCGFEYWTRTFKKDQYLKVHVDEDTFAYQKDKTFNAPVYGCIWYGFAESDDPGFLELHQSRIEGNPKNVLESDSIDTLLSPAEKRERLAYVPNRLVCFDAGRRLHETTATGSGVRQVMVINLWTKDSPPSALSTGEFYYE